MCMFYFKDKIDAHKMNTELGICLYVLKSRYTKHCIYNKKTLHTLLYRIEFKFRSYLCI